MTKGGTEECGEKKWWERTEGGGRRRKKDSESGSVLSERDMSEVRFGQRMFGDSEVAKWEGTGRTERRSAADLSTHTAALLLSTRPQADKESSAYTE